MVAMILVLRIFLRCGILIWGVFICWCNGVLCCCADTLLYVTYFDKGLLVELIKYRLLSGLEEVFHCYRRDLR